MQKTKRAIRISALSMAINLILFAAKLFFGLIIKSTSLVSDAVHSLSDILSTAIVLAGIRISSKPADKTHPYGHEKIETVIAFLLGIMLFVIGAAIGFDGIKKIIDPVFAEAQNALLNTGAIIVAVFSIIGKEWMYRFTKKCAADIRSSAMKADAWHHRTDALSSIGSLIAVIGLRLGYPIIDAIACLVIALFIFKAAFDIVASAFHIMVDRTCADGIERQIKQIVLSSKEVLSIDILMTRSYGTLVYVDLEVTLNKNLSFERSHEIACQIHDNVEKGGLGVKHCMVHVNPLGCHSIAENQSLL